MFKETKDRKENLEVFEEIKEARDFFISQLPLGPCFEHLSTDQLFLFYQNFINQDASRSNFEKFLAAIKKDKRDLEEAYRQYLLRKLPREVAQRAEGYDIKQLEEIHTKRRQNHFSMKLGFHVSNAICDNVVSQSKIESVTVIDGKNITVPAGYAHYTFSSKGLPKCRAGYLYFVEGSEFDLRSETMKSYMEAHQKAGWVATARELPILKRLELTDNLVKALGLEFY